MAIARKLRQENTNEKPVVNEKKVDALIFKGGTSTKKQQLEQIDDAEKKPIKLLPYQTQLNEIETILSQLPKRGRPSRHAYILQAIDEKVERDKKKLKLN